MPSSSRTGDKPEIPEPFRAALQGGEPGRVSDHPAEAPLERYGRGLARTVVGREADARADFQAASDALGDICRVELGFLDIRDRSGLRRALQASEELLDLHAGPCFLRARSLHLKGLALGKLRRSRLSVQALFDAQNLYREIGEGLLSAQVQDTLGMVFGASGQLDLALTYYSLSLVQKLAGGDRYGAAISLGNMGRVHLRAGRYREAMVCLAEDHVLARNLGDQRGCARILNDMARVAMGRSEWGQAREKLDESLAIVRRNGFSDIEYFLRKDRALLLIRTGELEAALGELVEAEALLTESGEPYLEGLLLAARGEWQLARDEDLEAATELLERAARVFESGELPDSEIPTLVLLAEAYMRRRLKQSAESCLQRANRRARADGYARYLPSIREAMVRLAVVEGLVEESGRQIVAQGEPELQSSYVVLAEVGHGSFGTLYKAFDACRSEVVALKRLQLDGIYSDRDRARILGSLRQEFEAASRIRHPGIARVLAVGEDEAGRPYVVQEFVDGSSLRQHIPRRPDSDVALVLEKVKKIAEALAVLHERGIIHRDLKPENVILRPGNLDPVIVDFGIAKLGRGAASDGAFVGTLGYVAPEQAQGRKVTETVDVYALGVVCFEWLTGVKPLRSSSRDPGESLKELAAKTPDSLALHRPGLPSELDVLLRRMLGKKPRRRPRAAEVAEACRTLESLQARSKGREREGTSG